MTMQRIAAVATFIYLSSTPLFCACTDLHSAAQKGYTKECEQLVEQGANIHACTQLGYTPLHLAAENGRETTCLYLLNEGADVHAENSEGWTPLHLAVKNRYSNTTGLLLQQGADINAETNKGLTPLHIAALRGTRDICDLLLKRGANINAKVNKKLLPYIITYWQGNSEACYASLLGSDCMRGTIVQGYTPLHCAAYKSHQDVVTLLLKKGADVYLENNDGKTAFDLTQHDGIKHIMTTHETTKISGYLATITTTHDFPQALIGIFLTFSLGK